MKENVFLNGLENIESDIVEKFLSMDNELQKNANKSKKKNIWLRFGAVAACFALLTGIAVIVPMLQKNPDTTDPHTTESTDCTEDINKYNNSDYSIIESDDGYSIIFENSEKYKVSDDMQACMLGSIDFPSMKEFKDTVTKGLLTDRNK